ncbi:MAG TPA: IS110 family transposase [Isosphaeraceae bacterium]|nr:IS110 family transposase [Isosphaeraceae bacterium]
MTDSKSRNSSVVRNLSDALRLGPGETAYVGVDVHKATYHVAVYSAQRGLIATWVQPASPGALIERLGPVRGHVAEVVYEAGPTGFQLVRSLRAAGFTAQVIATSKVPTPACPEAKCDRLDCRRLALLASKGMLHPVRVPTEQEEADRQVLRLREQLIRKCRSIQQQVKALLLQHGVAEPDGLAHWAERAVEALRGLELLPELRFCLDVMLDELEHAVGQVQRVTKRLEELSQAERHGAAAGAMRSVPGVGLVTAMTFRLELAEPERFVDAGQVAKMAGLAPMVRQSGETRRAGGLIRSSSARLRTALVEAAWRWVACDEAAKAVYRRLVGNTGSGKKAIVGVARRLGVLLWRLSTRGTPYRAAA